MPNVKWLLQDNVFEEECFNRLVDALKELQMEHKIIKYVPFGGGYYNPTIGKEIPNNHRFFDKDDCIIFYGSMNMCSRLLANNANIPLAWYNQDNLSCQKYYSHWGKFLLQSDAFFVPFADLLRPQKVELLFDQIGETLFIRPNANDKIFTGKVVSRGEDFNKWLKMEIECYNPDKGSLIVVGPRRAIGEEWRLVICERKIISYSLYRNFHGKLEYKNTIDPEALVFAEKVIKHEWQPHDMYILDICRTYDWGCEEDPDYAVMEIGSFNTAGLYACDMMACVKAASELASTQWEEIFGGVII